MHVSESKIYVYMCWALKTKFLKVRNHFVTVLTTLFNVRYFVLLGVACTRSVIEEMRPFFPIKAFVLRVWTLVH